MSKEQMVRGALVTKRDGRDVVLNYGSEVGELTACVRHVGLVERTDLRAIVICGSERAIDAASVRLCGSELAVGGGLPIASSWWTRPDAGRLLILCPLASADRISRIARADAAHDHELSVESRRDEHELLGVVGRSAAVLLAEVGAYGPDCDPLVSPPCPTTDIDGVSVTWVHESAESAIACVAAASLPILLAAVERAGRPLGIARVGQDAYAHWGVGERQRRRLAH